MFSGAIIFIFRSLYLGRYCYDLIRKWPWFSQHLHSLRNLKKNLRKSVHLLFSENFLVFFAPTLAPNQAKKSKKTEIPLQLNIFIVFSLNFLAPHIGSHQHFFLILFSSGSPEKKRNFHYYSWILWKWENYWLVIIDCKVFLHKSVVFSHLVS